MCVGGVNPADEGGQIKSLIAVPAEIRPVLGAGGVILSRHGSGNISISPNQEKKGINRRGVIFLFVL